MSRKDARIAQIARAIATLAIFASLSAAPALAQHPFPTRHVPKAVLNGQARFLHGMSPSQTMEIDVVLQMHNQAALTAFLQQVYNPSSPTYRHFLTVRQFTGRFGPTQAEYSAATDYLKSYGFRIVGGTRDSMEIQAVGSVDSVERAFNLNMGVYQHPTENRTFYAPDREPTVNGPLALWHVSGLENYFLPRPAVAHRRPGAGGSATTGSGPGSSFLGSDMRAAYYGGTALTGAGQDIGLLEYHTCTGATSCGYNMSDVDTYYSNVGQTLTATVTGISTDGSSLTCLASDGCDDLEATIDITQALGMAPGVSTLYVYVGNTDTALLGAMSSDIPLPWQLSSSWQWSPADPATDDPYFERMAAQGQTFFQASGDYGSYPSSVADYYPAEDDYVVSVGGTDVTTTSAGGPWSSETAWADSGGGVAQSTYFTIPSWQQLTGVINSSNEGSTAYRNVPDVAANANFTYYVCADQTTCTENVWGGTSFAAPLWAGYMALINEQAADSGYCQAGDIDPPIYSIGVGSGYSAAFHDVTSGSNGMYSAVTGYDLVTGWGSPNGAGLVLDLASTSQCPTASASPTTLSFDSRGDEPVTNEATLTNNGPGSLSIDVYAIDVTGDAFYLGDTNCSGALAPGKSCYADVVFEPSGCLTSSGQLVFNDTAGGQAVSLSGRTTACQQLPRSSAAKGGTSAGSAGIPSEFSLQGQQ